MNNQIMDVFTSGKKLTDLFKEGPLDHKLKAIKHRYEESNCKVGSCQQQKHGNDDVFDLVE